MRTRWSRNRLDAELSSGADPLASPALERDLDELVRLVERLCDGRPIDVRGAALTARLVSDVARTALDEPPPGDWELLSAA